MVQALPRVDLETADVLRAQHAADESTGTNPPAPGAAASPRPSPPSLPPPHTTPIAVAAASANHLARRATGSYPPPQPHTPMHPQLLRRQQVDSTRRRGARMRVSASGGQHVRVSTAVLPSDHVEGTVTDRMSDQEPPQARAGHGDGAGLADSPHGGDEEAPTNGAAAQPQAEQPDAEQLDAEQPDLEDDLMRPTPASSKATVRTAQHA